MIKKLLKNKLFIVLVLIIAILLIIRIISNKQTKTPPLSPDQKPYQSSFLLPTNQNSDKISSTPTIKITEINYQIPLYNFLPYQGKYFQANRYIRANNIETKVYNRKDTDLAKKEIQEWLAKYGVENIDKFTIIY
ncbi:MAG: hypothetical protein PHX84_03515 [Candidatus Shapirobacteria bacterium]|jgi:hypothetical protein|nr:hypothetical protein [Candidatus Shapirobacteria bacterium]